MERQMKRAIQGSLAMAVLLLALGVDAKTASEVYDAVSPSVVVIRTYDANVRTFQLGSGVAVANNVIVTNCHVIKDATKIQVVHQGKEYSAVVRHSDWDRDICTLNVSGINAIPVIIGNTRRLKVGTRVYAIGAPRGLELTLSEGIISSLRLVEGGQYLQITAPISQGSSGGGLFDEEGRLIGLPTFYLSEGQQLNFAVPVEWINELPKRHEKGAKVSQATTIDWFKKAVMLDENEDRIGLLGHTLCWIKAQPKDSTAWFGLGLAYAKSGQPAKAIEAYHQALRINPKYADAWNNLGVACMESGEQDTAVEAYHQALRINPEDPNPWFNLGVFYKLSGQSPRVLEVYKRLKTLDPAKADQFFNEVVLP
jgi:predicted TPR repeat methyltransferase